MERWVCGSEILIDAGQHQQLAATLLKGELIWLSRIMEVGFDAVQERISAHGTGLADPLPASIAPSAVLPCPVPEGVGLGQAENSGFMSMLQEQIVPNFAPGRVMVEPDDKGLAWTSEATRKDEFGSLLS